MAVQTGPVGRGSEFSAPAFLVLLTGVTCGVAEASPKEGLPKTAKGGSTRASNRRIQRLMQSAGGHLLGHQQGAGGVCDFLRDT